MGLRAYLEVRIEKFVQSSVNLGFRVWNHLSERWNCLDSIIVIASWWEAGLRKIDLFGLLASGRDWILVLVVRLSAADPVSTQET